MRWFENVDGQGRFNHRGVIKTLATAVSAISVGDLNHDEFPDLVAVTVGRNSTTRPQFVAFSGSNNGFIPITTPKTNSTKNDIVSVEIADLNNDEDAEVLLGFIGGQLQIVTFDAGEFDSGPILSSEMDDPRSLSIVDIDSDGDMDIFVAATGSDRVAWLENIGEHVFVASSAPIANVPNPTGIAIADIDADGDFDVIAGIGGGATSRVAIIENRLIGDVNNDGRFNSSDLVAVFQSGQYEDDLEDNSTFASGDWNGDGEFTTSDLVAAFTAGTYSANATPVDTLFETWDNDAFSIEEKRTIANSDFNLI